jgi:3-hydroxyisobutyrate dehydrogenase-like beta-hydroxyacid dehydrogenase
MKENVGLIGIGLVGAALAENLNRAGYFVVGCDIDSSRCRHLEKMGGRAVSTPREVAANVRRVFLSLMTTDIVRAVLMGSDGVLQAHKPPDYIIDTTTGDPDGTVEIARQLEKQNIRYLDAPISGSSQQIRNREGVVMVGGRHDAYRRCHDLFGAIARDVVYIGPSGSGARAKLVSNVILGLNRLVLAEGLVFAERFGFELSAFLELLKKTPAYSCAMDVKGQKMIDGDFSPQSRVAQHFKDLKLSLRYAEKLGQPLPLTRLHKKILADMIAAGDGGLDNAAVVKHFRRLANRSE